MRVKSYKQQVLDAVSCHSKKGDKRAIDLTERALSNMSNRLLRALQEYSDEDAVFAVASLSISYTTLRKELSEADRAFVDSLIRTFNCEICAEPVAFSNPPKSAATV